MNGGPPRNNPLAPESGTMATGNTTAAAAGPRTEQQVSLERLDITSPESAGLWQMIQESFLDRNYSQTNLSPAVMLFVHNSSASARYSERVAELRQKHGCVEERLGFICLPHKEQVVSLLRHGFTNIQNGLTYFGSADQPGVHLCRHADVCLDAWQDKSNVYLVVVMVTVGACQRQTPLEHCGMPSPEFDTCISTELASLDDPLPLRTVRSYMYSWEYDGNCRLVPPRQVLPSAVLGIRRGPPPTPLPPQPQLMHQHQQHPHQHQQHSHQHQQSQHHWQQPHHQQYLGAVSCPLPVSSPVIGAQGAVWPGQGSYGISVPTPGPVAPFPRGLLPVNNPVSMRPTPVTNPVSMRPTPVTNPVSMRPTPVNNPVSMRPMPVTNPMLMRPTPVTNPMSVRPMPVNNPVSMRPMPVNNPVSMRPMPVTNPMSVRPMPVNNPMSMRPTPVTNPMLMRPTPVTNPMSVRPMPVTNPMSVRPTPVTNPMSMRPMPVTNPVSVRPTPVTNPMPVRPTPVTNPVSIRPTPVTYPVSVRPTLAAPSSSSSLLYLDNPPPTPQPVVIAPIDEVTTEQMPTSSLVESVPTSQPNDSQLRAWIIKQERQHVTRASSRDEIFIDLVEDDEDLVSNWQTELHDSGDESESCVIPVATTVQPRPITNVVLCDPPNAGHFEGTIVSLPDVPMSSTHAPPQHDVAPQERKVQEALPNPDSKIGLPKNRPCPLEQFLHTLTSDHCVALEYSDQASPKHNDSQDLNATIPYDIVENNRLISELLSPDTYSVPPGYQVPSSSEAATVGTATVVSAHTTVAGASPPPILLPLSSKPTASLTPQISTKVSKVLSSSEAATVGTATLVSTRTIVGGASPPPMLLSLSSKPTASSTPQISTKVSKVLSSSEAATVGTATVVSTRTTVAGASPPPMLLPLSSKPTASSTTQISTKVSKVPPSSEAATVGTATVVSTRTTVAGASPPPMLLPLSSKPTAISTPQISTKVSKDPASSDAASVGTATVVLTHTTVAGASPPPMRLPLSSKPTASSTPRISTEVSTAPVLTQSVRASELPPNQPPAPSISPAHPSVATPTDLESVSPQRLSPSAVPTHLTVAPALASAADGIQAQKGPQTLTPAPGSPGLVSLDRVPAAPKKTSPSEDLTGDEEEEVLEEELDLQAIMDGEDLQLHSSQVECMSGELHNGLVDYAGLALGLDTDGCITLGVMHQYMEATNLTLRTSQDPELHCNTFQGKQAILRLTDVVKSGAYDRNKAEFSDQEAVVSSTNPVDMVKDFSCALEMPEFLSDDEETMDSDPSSNSAGCGSSRNQDSCIEEDFENERDGDAMEMTSSPSKLRIKEPTKDCRVLLSPLDENLLQKAQIAMMERDDMGRENSSPEEQGSVVKVDSDKKCCEKSSPEKQGSVVKVDSDKKSCEQSSPEEQGSVVKVDSDKKCCEQSSPEEQGSVVKVDSDKKCCEKSSPEKQGSVVKVDSDKKCCEQSSPEKQGSVVKVDSDKKYCEQSSPEKQGSVVKVDSDKKCCEQSSPEKQESVQSLDHTKPGRDDTDLSGRASPPLPRIPPMDPIVMNVNLPFVPVKMHYDDLPNISAVIRKPRPDRLVKPHQAKKGGRHEGKWPLEETLWPETKLKLDGVKVKPHQASKKGGRHEGKRPLEETLWPETKLKLDGVKVKPHQASKKGGRHEGKRPLEETLWPETKLKLDGVKVKPHEATKKGGRHEGKQPLEETLQFEKKLKLYGVKVKPCEAKKKGGRHEGKQPLEKTLWPEKKLKLDGVKVKPHQTKKKGGRHEGKRPLEKTLWPEKKLKLNGVKVCDGKTAQSSRSDVELLKVNNEIPERKEGTTECDATPTGTVSCTEKSAVMDVDEEVTSRALSSEGVSSIHVGSGSSANLTALEVLALQDISETEVSFEPSHDQDITKGTLNVASREQQSEQFSCPRAPHAEDIVATPTDTREERIPLRDETAVLPTDHREETTPPTADPGVFSSSPVQTPIPQAGHMTPGFITMAAVGKEISTPKPCQYEESGQRSQPCPDVTLSLEVRSNEPRPTDSAKIKTFLSRDHKMVTERLAQLRRYRSEMQRCGDSAAEESSCWEMNRLKVDMQIISDELNIENKFLSTHHRLPSTLLLPQEKDEPLSVEGVPLVPMEPLKPSSYLRLQELRHCIQYTAADYMKARMSSRRLHIRRHLQDLHKMRGNMLRQFCLKPRLGHEISMIQQGINWFSKVIGELESHTSQSPHHVQRIRYVHRKIHLYQRHKDILAHVMQMTPPSPEEILKYLDDPKSDQHLRTDIPGDSVVDVARKATGNSGKSRQGAADNPPELRLVKASDKQGQPATSNHRSSSGQKESSKPSATPDGFKANHQRKLSDTEDGCSGVYDEAEDTLVVADCNKSIPVVEVKSSSGQSSSDLTSDQIHHMVTLAKVDKLKVTCLNKSPRKPVGHKVSERRAEDKKEPMAKSSPRSHKHRLSHYGYRRGSSSPENSPPLRHPADTTDRRSSRMEDSPSKSYDYYREKRSSRDNRTSASYRSTECSPYSEHSPCSRGSPGQDYRSRAHSPSPRHRRVSSWYHSPPRRDIDDRYHDHYRRSDRHHPSPPLSPYHRRYSRSPDKGYSHKRRSRSPVHRRYSRSPLREYYYDRDPMCNKLRKRSYSPEQFRDDTRSYSLESYGGRSCSGGDQSGHLADVDMRPHARYFAKDYPPRGSSGMDYHHEHASHAYHHPEVRLTAPGFNVSVQFPVVPRQEPPPPYQEHPPAYGSQAPPPYSYSPPASYPNQPLCMTSSLHQSPPRIDGTTPSI